MALKIRNLFITGIALVLFTSACSLFGGGGGDPVPVPLSAVLSEITGSVQITKGVDGSTLEASDGAPIVLNDRVFTNQNSRARVDISSGALIRMSPLTTFVLTTMENNNNDPLTRLKLEAGRLWIILNGGSVEVDTPAGQASVRGSYLHVWVNTGTGETEISCLEGNCQLGNNGGTLDLVAGQTARIANGASPPSPGRMSDGDVDEWLAFNPEATLVIVPLTATSAVVDLMTPTAYKYSTPTPFPTNTPFSFFNDTSTPPPTDTNCGPNPTWIFHTVKSGETVESIASLYRVETEAVRTANCFPVDFVLPAGMEIYVPDVATSTPIPGSSATIPASGSGSGSGYKATSGVTMTPAAIGPGTNGTIVSLYGPPFTISKCSNTYGVMAVDINVIDSVSIEFSINDYLFSSPITVEMVDIGNSIFEKTVTIYTDKNPGYDIVLYRYVMKDKTGFRQSYPDTYPYFYGYQDYLDCAKPGLPTATPIPPNKPSVFTFMDGPLDGSSITAPTQCSNLYRVKVTDQEGVKKVFLVTSINDPSFASPTYTLLNKGVLVNVWRLKYIVDTTLLTPPIDIYYKFKSVDMKGVVSYSSYSAMFTDTIGCP